MPAIPQNKLKYTFHSASAGDRQVYPTGESTFKMKYELYDDPDDPRFDYDLQFQGTLVFVGEDYAWIKALEESDERCDTLLIEMNSPDCDEDVDIFPGTYVKLSDGEYDIDKCKVSVTVTSPDKYECFNANKDDTLNIFDATATRIEPILYDASIVFEFMEWDQSNGPFDFDHQDFSFYPNINSEYPGFGCEGEDFFITGGDNEKLYTDPVSTFAKLETHVTTGKPKLHDGEVPAVDPGLYASAALAAAQGWRLCYSRFEIDAEASLNLSWNGRWVWVRQTKTVPTGTPMPGWIYQSTVGPDDIFARAPVLNKKTRGVDETGENFYSSISWGDTLGGRPAAFRSEMVNYIVGYDGTGPEKFGAEILLNGVPFKEITEYALAHCCPDLTVKSDFFQINPWTVSSDNPITGAESTTNEIIVFQKSDVKRPFDSGRATIGNFTPAQWMSYLWEMFECKFRIVGSVFMIEHKSSALFNHATVIDLTVDPFNRMLDGTRVYVYDKTNLPSKETFAFMDTRPDINIYGFGDQSDFVGAHLLYDGNCVDRSKTTGTKGHTVSGVTTDIEYIIAFGKSTDSSISDDGFVFCSTKLDGGDYYVRSMPPIIGATEQINNVFGWAFLHDMFFRTDRNAATGTMNNMAISFDSVKYIKRTKTLAFSLCCIDDFDPYAFIECALGTGIFKTVEFSIYNSIMRVELGLRG